MGSIAEASGVSVKTLYNLFGSRDELLLDAATSTLATLGESEGILAENEGIPRLLAYVVGTMNDFLKGPTYAHAVISTLAKADMGLPLTERYMGVVRRYAEASLAVAARNQELIPDLDIKPIAQHISANQWGAVLLWIKGLMPIEDLPDHIARSHYMTLLPVTRGSRHDQLRQDCTALLRASTSLRR